MNPRFVLAALISLFLFGCDFTEKVVDKPTSTASSPIDDPIDNPGNSVGVVPLKITSHSPGERVESQVILLAGECSDDLGEIKVEGDFAASPQFIDCVDQHFQLFVSLVNFNDDNRLSVSQGSGADETQSSLTVQLFVRAPYCGDDIVNQDFEVCDGSLDCDDFCQTGGSNPDLVLARIKVFSRQSSGAGRVTDDVFLGNGEQSIPAGVWFPLFLNNQFFVDSSISGLTSVPGVLVRRMVTGVKVMMATGLSSGDFEHLSGVLEFHNASAKIVSGGIGGEALENGQNGLAELDADEDEIFIESGASHFWFSERTGHDAYFTEWQ